MDAKVRLQPHRDRSDIESHCDYLIFNGGRFHINKFSKYNNEKLIRNMPIISFLPDYCIYIYK